MEKMKRKKNYTPCPPVVEIERKEKDERKMKNERENSKSRERKP
jgi:hypothetical protein